MALGTCKFFNTQKGYGFIAVRARVEPMPKQPTVQIEGLEPACVRLGGEQVMVEPHSWLHRVQTY
jgi:hypothetical protein